MSELYHYGTKRHSGRYPWGSGDVPYQHENNFLNTLKSLQAQGLSEKEQADYFGMSTTELRQRKSYEKAELRSYDLNYILDMLDKGYSKTAIAEKMGRNESYVRSLLDPVVKERIGATNNVADVLKSNIESKQFIDVGAGTNAYLNVSAERLNSAVRKLVDEEGYKLYYLNIEQAGNPGKYTSVKVLAAPGMDYRDVYNNRDKIGFVSDFYTNDGGKTFLGIKPPASVDSSRLMVRYAEDGGTDMDGVIQLKRGVDDISLQGANYAQVRIAVDGTHYLKGMAIYGEDKDFPPGVDIIFNTNKHVGTPALGDKDHSVLKLLKTDKQGNIDKDNPFGSTLKMEDGVIVGQRNYISKEGKTELSPINIVREEGDWNTWSATLSAQFLSKQPKQLITQQLKKSYDDKKEEYDEIMQITQPEVRKKLLDSFADDCDASASHLKAAALPRQSSKVILPLNDISEKEVYAPTYRDGEQVALVRYPHGGTFEIPILTVNNKIQSGKNILGNAVDGIGINSKVAGRLSGADFDGDTVMVIPTINQKISSTPPLEGLKNFDPKERYPAVEGMKVMSKGQKQNEMGKVSNLITDMTIRGATPDELERAVKHSMVVIDAEKHKLNYKLSEVENGIAELKTKYQGGPKKGASTLISKANADIRVPLRKELPPDKETGERRYDYNVKDRTYMKPIKDKNGNVKYFKETERTQTSTWMNETKDAYDLSSGTVKESLYANYANSLKALANNARKESVNSATTKVNPSAKETYAKEVSSLNAKLNIALKNKPRERAAQIMADVTIQSKKKSNPDLAKDKDELKKVKTQALAAARDKAGAKKGDSIIKITPSEWEAINSGALSSSKIKSILDNTDLDELKKMANPRETRVMTPSQEARIRALNNNGYTLAEIADSVGVSTTKVSEVLK